MALAKLPGAKAYHTLKGAPNPWFVECFAMERGVDIFSIVNAMDGAKNEHRTDPKYQALNPAGGTPFMELDDGSCIAETVTICNMMDEMAPGGPQLTGADPREKATISMWLRRIEQHIVLGWYAHLRWGPAKERFKERGHHGMLASDTAAQMQLDASKNQLEWLDGLMVKAGNPEFICCNKLTICDIMLATQIDFFDNVNKGLFKTDWFKNLKWVPGWHAKISERPAFTKSKAWNGSHDQSKL